MIQNYDAQWRPQEASEFLITLGFGDIKPCLLHSTQIERSHSTHKSHGETADISEYLDFAFYDQVWYKDNAESSPFDPGWWLGVSERTGLDMCYHVLNKNGNVVLRSTVYRVTEIKKSTLSTKDIFNKFDAMIAEKFKVVGRNYVGNKLDPEDLAKYIDNKEDFKEEFLRIYDNNTIPKASNYSPDVLDNTYLNMEVALP